MGDRLKMLPNTKIKSGLTNKCTSTLALLKCIFLYIKIIHME